jgi:sulfate adenylyltransferase
VKNAMLSRGGHGPKRSGGQNVTVSDSPERLQVLFVCTANISRSPYLELVARSRSDGAIEFASAGVWAHDGTLIDPAMAVELTARGIGSDAFRSRRLTGSMIGRADLVLTAEARHRAAILDEHPIATRKVLTIGQADRALDRIEPDVPASDLAAALVAARGGATEDLDIVDPYRRGPEAARACALILDRLVDRLLARLMPAPLDPAVGGTAETR